MRNKITNKYFIEPVSSLALAGLQPRMEPPRSNVTELCSAKTYDESINDTEDTTMENTTKRQNKRVEVSMNLRSVSLPHYSAEVIDICETGARIRLKGEPEAQLQEARIRFGLSLADQVRVQFEGLARVAWVRSTKTGVEAGLQWEKMTQADWLRAKAAVPHGSAA
jgi:hypothetical protein